MGQPRTKESSTSKPFRIVLLAILFPTACGTTTWALFFSSHAIQARNMAAARNHVPLVENAIAGDDDFKSITIGVYTGGDGMLWIIGRVSSNESARRLRVIVEDTNPPVPIHWTVESDEDIESRSKTGDIWEE